MLKPARHTQADRMIGEGDHLHAAFCRGTRHLQHGEFPIAPGGVHLQVRFHILFLDQLRELVRFGSLDLAAVFAQLGGNPGKPKRFIDFLFRRAKDFTPIEDVLEGMIG